VKQAASGLAAVRSPRRDSSSGPDRDRPGGHIPAAAQGNRPTQQRRGGRTYPETSNAGVRAGTVTHAGIRGHLRHPGVTYRPLDGLPPARAALAWQVAADTPQVRAFAALGPHPHRPPRRPPGRARVARTRTG
jgi:hypothetical protein